LTLHTAAAFPTGENRRQYHMVAGLDKGDTRPSFAFVNEYQGRLPVLHLDLYRIEGVDMALELGVLDLLRQAESGVAMIEWADRISALLSDSYLAVNFSVLSARNREIVLSAFGEQFRRLLDEVEGQ